MHKHFKITVAVFVSMLVFMSGCSESLSSRRDRAGVSRVDASEVTSVDQTVRDYLDGYSHINISLVRHGRIVFTKSYGSNRLAATDSYASVSKPVTATILMQLVEEDKIRSLDDPICDYDARYRQADGSCVTFRHLLTHTSGLPRNSSMFAGRKLDLDFAPGQSCSYSNRGYGVLGDVMEHITGMSYEQLLERYIAQPANAKSFRLFRKAFDAPAIYVASTIGDMARFAIALMGGRYYQKDKIGGQVLRQYAKDEHGPIGLGWFCLNSGRTNVTAYHAGSDGRIRAFLLMKPNSHEAVAVTARANSWRSPHELPNLSMELLRVLEGRSRRMVSPRYAGTPSDSSVGQGSH